MNRLLIVIVAALAAFLITSLALGRDLKSESMPGYSQRAQGSPSGRHDGLRLSAFECYGSSMLRGSASCPE